MVSEERFAAVHRQITSTPKYVTSHRLSHLQTTGILQEGLQLRGITGVVGLKLKEGIDGGLDCDVKGGCGFCE
ncbi:hypothetical protein V6N12_068519 [Hibiscus sabdariffa]|uniref:Uncharacterized protein n=1 Tax=Hibiscus sabdariffa TaxID=183260 RepID=A0ABR2FQD4_9ROSI